MAVQAAFIVPHPPIVLPEIGQGREREIAATTESFRAVAARIGELRPDTILVFSPHAVAYSDYIHISPGEEAEGDLAPFGAPGPLHATYDTELVRAIAAYCKAEGFPAGTLGERDPALDHGVLIPLRFINETYSDYKLVRISLSGLSREEHYRFGMLLNRCIEALGRNTVIIASGDLSHKLLESGPYGYVPEGPKLDKALTAAMERGSFWDFLTLPDALTDKGADCGLLSFVMMAGVLDCKAVKPRLLSYEGPFGVGYGVASFEVLGEDPGRNFLDQQKRDRMLDVRLRREAEDAYVRLARETLEAYVLTGKMPFLSPELPPELLYGQAGVFVSIKRDGRLRGCIGTIDPAKLSIAEEIRTNAVSAGTRDPRFSPVGPGELEELVYSVDVLLPPEPAEIGTLDPARYGVIVTSGLKRGLLLPDLDGIETVGEQITVAMKKAGIKPDDSYSLERFEVVRHY
ncbi:AmmeMemoRadiSam system protein A [Ruminococcaceae bacterium OttesenSCG-928-L11]|nr:AmmeMemoRadiSam system protein A [Ruminococcaceae bacterium OttesenSCG-928-L11]